MIGCAVDRRFIFADFATDPLVKSLALTSVKRQLYQTFDVKIVLAKGEHGKEVDQFLSDTSKKRKDAGKYAPLMESIDTPLQRLATVAGNGPLSRDSTMAF